jgi:hypothetical protein
MYLVSKFRRVAFVGEPFTRAVFARETTVANRPPINRPAAPRQEDHNRPQLTCEWQVSDEPFVRLGNQTFRCGDMFMHWMPVH